MSGRSGYRKTDRKVLNRRTPAEMPDFVLRYQVPHNLMLSVAPGPTSVIGVKVVMPGPFVEVTGKNRDWVLEKAGEFLGAIAGGLVQEVTAILRRGDEPTQSREMVYVPDASVVYMHKLKKVLVFKVKR